MTAPFSWSETLLASMDEAVYVVDRDRRITYWNPAAERLTGFAAAEVVGRRCQDGVLSHVDERGWRMCSHRCPLSSTLCGGDVSEVTAYLHHRDGHRIPVAITTWPLYDADGAIEGAVEVFHDNGRSEEVRAALRRAEALGLLDPLTAVHHRQALEADLAHRHDVLTRTGRSYAIALIDVDRLATVNDAHGQEAGDRVLRLVAATSRHVVRPDDTVGRWAGKEFLLLAEVGGLPTAVAICHRVRNLVAKSWVDMESGPLRVSVSIGVTVAEPGLSRDELVTRADHALLGAKAAGRNRVFRSDREGTAVA